MSQAMSLSTFPTAVITATPSICSRSLGSWKVMRPLHSFTLPCFQLKHPPIFCTKLSSWEPSPTTYAPSEDGDDDGNFLQKGANIFETMNAEMPTETMVSNKVEGTKEQASLQSQPLKWPMWLLGPSILLVTGIVPTLWLPLSSVFLGANTASLLSLVGLDCIFNIGATLFLLMADACARPKNASQTLTSQAPLSYKFWNMVASVTGCLIPLGMLFASQKGLLQTQLPLMSFGVLLGPYLLLLSIQMLTEMLTWYWQSPVWLMTPVVYEAYRVLQLLRGLKLSAEIGAPMWIVETIRGLVSWWVLILGVQLMRVAWFAGFSARARQQT
ncbi:hypothetical protein IFM89_027567 [Coptis chinensis]|uniref:Uncharacterized protein n=1 Tax=Coptis chinensis TaxID=261450 RepID=A0A835LNQ7_9MAGN|nr:hypothetical protein IFM89_027567 [Coptis chinensis]